MKVRLLHPDHDAPFDAKKPDAVRFLIEDDLELRRIYHAMAAGDQFLLDTVQKVLPLSETEPDVITYRQQVLADCLENRELIEQLYAIAVDADEVRRKIFLSGLVYREPGAILQSAVRMLEPLAVNLKELRSLCDENAHLLTSPGFRQLVATVDEQLSDDYLHLLDEQLHELKLTRGVLLSAQLGLGNKGYGHTLHQPPHRSWWEKITGTHSSGYGFQIEDRDQAGAQALVELAGRAINDVANTVMQSAHHVRGFFHRLRTELAFYLACANLHDRLAKSGVPTCFPCPTNLDTRTYRCRGLRDVALCLATNRPVAGNDVGADGTSLILVTGANEGGKSTFLRSVGSAQMMMQAGMFVTATSMRANAVNGVFTHFKREEDATMTHGKFDEELARMSTIADHIGTQSMLLCNESFASTNEREGAQIARGIIDAMLDCRIKVVYVTHMYDLARSLYQRCDPTYTFLRAERRPDGARTFRMKAAEPEPTSYGEDSFLRVFGGRAVADREQTG